MGYERPEAYNAKGRRSTAGSRKKGKGKHTPTESASANTEIHVPKSKEQKDLERKERLKEEILAQENSKWNNKKRKRLDKYIDKKLKKEERVAILEKLSQTQAQMPSTVLLQSSATLGTGRSATHRELLDKQEDKEVRRALAGTAGKRNRNTDVYTVENADSESSDEDDDLGTGGVEIIDLTSKPVAGPSGTVGSALRPGLDGALPVPTIRKKKKNKSVFASWKSKVKPSAPEPESDTSFDSSDSANDSSQDEMASDGDDSDQHSGSNSEEEEEVDEESEGEPEPPKQRLGFKDWALKQLDIAKGYNVEAPPATDPAPPDPLPSAPPKKKRKVVSDGLMHGPTGEDFKLPSTALAQRLLDTSSDKTSLKAQSVIVSRPADVEEARIHLPIVSEEQPIMEAVLLNPVVIICGETGSGKTTQLPQFLFEAGFGTPTSENPGMIGITQPRRVAAVSMANRVAHELSLTSSKVSYQIRYDATVSPSTAIKFMTDGVLLRELATDFLLTKYSVVIVDEAHERSVNTDIVIGVLSRVAKLREEMWTKGKDNVKPLRLIIMSATLRVSDFAANKTLFNSPPPIINVAARQHPVTIHFNKRTHSDYVTEAIKKTVKIHTRLPPGGILIFLTGQNEITGVCRKLEAKFGSKQLANKRGKETQIRQTVDPNKVDIEAEDMELGESQADNLATDVDVDMEDDDPDALDSDDEDSIGDLGFEVDGADAPMHVVPLYSLLPSEKQMLVFEPPPPGSRLVVVSTNVAETSLTIPGIRYVIDCGRAKERRYDISSGIQAFQVNWISKASAAQRAGRAGRTGPGHCYRLYSSALFEHHFDAFSQPELLRMPIDGVVLQMKSMHIDTVVNFPFPTPPDRTSLHKAETTLTHLGALSGGHITELGKMMSLFPLSPRFSRMLVGGQQHKCLPYVIAIVSALSVGDPFIHDETLRSDGAEVEDEDEFSTHLTSDKLRQKELLRATRKTYFASQHVHSSLGNYASDIFKMLSVVGAYEYAGGGHKFCGDNFVRLKAMEEIHKLRAQISNIVQMNFAGQHAEFQPKLEPPSALQLKVMRQLLAAAFIDQVAVRKDRIDRSASSTGAQHATCKGVAYKALGIGEDVFIHPSSVLANNAPPEYVVFNEVVRTSRVWIKGLTVVNPAWLSHLGKGSMCTFSKPMANNQGQLMVIPHFGPERWELPPIKAEQQSKS